MLPYGWVKLSAEGEVVVIRILALGAVFLALPAAVWAQEQQGIGRQPIRIVITKVDCSRLIRHVPAPDVAYQPGLDARGRAVAPADLPGSGADALPNLLPEVLEFPITINPVSYGARNQAQREKAAATQGAADTYAGKKAAQAQITTLTARKNSLTSQATALAGQKTGLDADYAAATTTLANLQAEVDGGTRAKSDRDYVRAKWAVEDKQTAVTAKQKEIDANTANLTATNTAIAAQQAVIDAAPAKAEQYAARESAAEAKLARLSSRGLDSTTMQVGTVRYDMARGIFTFNGEPIGGAEQQELAHACRKQGVR